MGFKKNKKKKPKTVELDDGHQIYSLHQIDNDIRAERIANILALRKLCRLLGKLGVKELIRVESIPPLPYPTRPPQISYGISLAEARLMIERYMKKRDPALNWDVIDK